MKKNLFLLLQFCTLVFAQAIVFGKVTEKQSGEPLPGVRIYSKEHKVSVATDFNGQFRLHVPVGVQWIGTNFMGMQSMFSKIDLVEGQEYRLDFALNDELLQEVVVEAQEKQQKMLQQTTSVETINTKILEDKNTNNVKTALDSKPGINMIDGEPQIRGGSGFTMGVGSRAAIVVDGISLLAGDSGQPQWDFVPLENIDHIDIIKGASSALYGANAMSGVIAIQTAYPTLEPKTKITTQFGFYDAPYQKSAKWWTGLQSQQGISFLHSRIINKNFDLVFGGNFFYDMGYLGGPDLKNFIKENGDYYYEISEGALNFENITSTGNLLGDYKTNFDPKKLHNQRYRFNFNTRYRFEKIQGLSLGLAGNVMFNHTSNVLTWLDGDKNIFRSYPGAMYLQDQTIFNLDPYLKYATPKGTSHNFNFRYLFTDNKIRDNKNNSQDNDSQMAFGEYQFKRQFPKILNVEMVAGLNFSYTHSDAAIYKVAGNGKSKYYMNSAAFLQFKKGFHFDRLLLNSIQLDLGGRVEYFNLNQEDEDFVPIVRTSMNFELIKGSFLRFAYGTGYRFPSITEKYMRMNMGVFAIFDNPNLKPESSHNLEVGLKQGFKWEDRFFGYFDLAYFFSIYDNTIEYLFGIWGQPQDRPFAGFKFQNTGQSTVSGVEASFYWEANLTRDKAHQLHGMGGYTWILPQTRQPNFPYDPDNLGLEYDYFSTSTNSKNNILKYRFLHTLKFDLDYSYQSTSNAWANISFGVSGRYFSKMENVDRSLKELETQSTPNQNSDPENTTEPDQFYPIVKFSSWLEKYNTGNFIWDARVGYAFGKYGKLSFVINNFTNAQYAIRPLKMESPRAFSFQYSITI